MRKRSSKQKRPRDGGRANSKGRSLNGDVAPPLAENVDGKNPAAVALGRLGGLKGGKARAKKLSQKQRTAIARKAANARWRKKK